MDSNRIHDNKYIWEQTYNFDSEQRVVVKFDSSNRPGMQRKAVTLITNTSKGKHILNIKSIVIPKS